MQQAFNVLNSPVGAQKPGCDKERVHSAGFVINEALWGVQQSRGHTLSSWRSVPSCPRET
jgi:hypothetical protein